MLPRKPWPRKIQQKLEKKQAKKYVVHFCCICFYFFSHVPQVLPVFELLKLYAFSGCTFTVRISSTACHIMLCILYVYYVFMIVDAIYRHLRHHSIDICGVFICFNHPFSRLGTAPSSHCLLRGCIFYEVGSSGAFIELLSTYF